MIQYVTSGRPVIARTDARARRTGFGVSARCAFMHSGQMTPTAAWVWHSGQMVRMQR